MELCQAGLLSARFLEAEVGRVILTLKVHNNFSLHIIDICSEKQRKNGYLQEFHEPQTHRWLKGSVGSDSLWRISLGQGGCTEWPWSHWYEVVQAHGCTRWRLKVRMNPCYQGRKSHRQIWWNLTVFQLNWINSDSFKCAEIFESLLLFNWLIITNYSIY